MSNFNSSPVALSTREKSRLSNAATVAINDLWTLYTWTTAHAAVEAASNDDRDVIDKHMLSHRKSTLQRAKTSISNVVLRSSTYIPATGQLNSFHGLRHSRGSKHIHDADWLRLLDVIMPSNGVNEVQSRNSTRQVSSLFNVAGNTNILYSAKIRRQQSRISQAKTADNGVDRSAAAAQSGSQSAASKSNDMWITHRIIPDKRHTTQPVLKTGSPVVDGIFSSKWTSQIDQGANSKQKLPTDIRQFNNLWRPSGSVAAADKRRYLPKKDYNGAKASVQNGLKFSLADQVVVRGHLKTVSRDQIGTNLPKRTRRDLTSSVDDVIDGQVQTSPDLVKQESTELKEMSMNLDVAENPSDVTSDQHAPSGGLLTNQRKLSDTDDSATDAMVTSSSGDHLRNTDVDLKEGDSERLNLELQSSHPVRQEDNTEVMSEQTGDDSDIYRRVNHKEGEGNLRNTKDQDAERTSSAVSMDAGENLVSSVNTSIDDLQSATVDIDHHYQSQGQVQVRNFDEKDTDNAASDAARDAATSKSTSRERNIETLDESTTVDDNEQLSRRVRTSLQAASPRGEHGVETLSEGLLTTGNTDEGGPVFTNGVDSLEADSDDGRAVSSRVSDTEGQSVEQVSERRRQRGQDVEETETTNKGITSKSSNRKSSSLQLQRNSVQSDDVHNDSLSSNDGTRSDRTDLTDNTNVVAAGATSVDVQQGESSSSTKRMNGKSNDYGSHHRDKVDGGGAELSAELHTESSATTKDKASGGIEDIYGPTRTAQRRENDVTHSLPRPVTSSTSSQQKGHFKVKTERNSHEKRQRKKITAASTSSMNTTTDEDQLIRSRARKPKAAGSHVIVEATLGIIGLSVIAFAIIGSVNLLNRKQLTKEREAASRDAINRKRSSPSSSLNSSAKRRRHPTPPRGNTPGHSSPNLPGRPKMASVKRASSLPIRRTPLTPPTRTMATRWVNVTETVTIGGEDGDNMTRSQRRTEQQNTRNNHMTIDMMAAATGSH